MLALCCITHSLPLSVTRAKNIKNTASINKDMTQKALLSAYQLEIKKLKEQLQSRFIETWFRYCKIELKMYVFRNEDLSKDEMEILEQICWRLAKRKCEPYLIYVCEF